MVVVLDCNIWITLIINSQLDFINNLLAADFEIASCQILRNEITEVLSRPKFKKFVNEELIEDIGQFHDLFTKQYTLDDIPKVVSDPKDDYLFALCIESRASYFATGDKLLLKQLMYNKTAIISLSALKNLVQP